jgi:hypothetical protein
MVSEKLIMIHYLKTSTRTCYRIAQILAVVVLTSCASDPYAKQARNAGFKHFQPSVVQIARMRVSGGTLEPFQNYHVTDRDVLDYTDNIKSLLSSKLTKHSTVRQGSSGLQVLLSSLISLVPAFGWSASAAGIMGGGSSFIHGIGGNIDSKGRAQAYETALASVQKAESTYYFYQTGMKFKTDNTGKKTVDYSDQTPNPNVPSGTDLTADGQTLYYRVTKSLQVLENALANKIPDLQDLKDAEGDTSTTSTTAPAK